MSTRRSRTRSDRRPPAWAGRPGACAGLLGVLAAAAGCLFEPRDAPPPCDPITDPTCRPPAVFVEPTEPAIVRDNIERALEAPTVDPNYRDSLSGVGAGADGLQFVYRPDNAVYELNPPLFDGWEEEREVQFMLNVLETGQNRARSVQVSFLEFFDTGVIPDGCSAGDCARYQLQYDIRMIFRDQSQDPPVEVERRFCAEAIWDLAGGSRNFWRVKRWEELRPLLLSGDLPCEGTLGLLRLERGVTN